MEIKLNNPFIISSQYAGEEYFCDRVSETETLVSNIKNSRNTVLISPRRMGKSGLIRNTFIQNDIAGKYTTIFVDIYSSSSLREFTLLFGKQVYNVLRSTQKKFADKFFLYVKSLACSASVDPLTGKPSLEIQLGQIRQPELTLEEIFSYLEASPKACVVAIDEFQQVADYSEKNTVALLRTYIQRCTKTRFIFSGSRRRMMDKLFNNPAEPFYMSCRSLYLEPIDRDVYFDFARSHFESSRKEIGRMCFDEIYDRFDGHTWYIQHLLNQLFEDTPRGKTAGTEMLSGATGKIVNSYTRSFQSMMRILSDRQKELVIAVAKEGKAKEVSSVSFVTSHALHSVSSVQSALRTLVENETLTFEGDSCFVTNRFFSIWIRDNY